MDYIMAIPKEKCLDSTWKLLTEGYLFIPNRCYKYHSDLFQTRIMGQKVICMTGEKAAKVFYNQYKFTRTGAMPRRIQETLFGKKAIQTLDGAEHVHRKKLFLSLMTQESIDRIVQLTKKQLQTNSKIWERKGQIVLFDEAAKLLCQVACLWAGVPLHKCEVKQKAEDLSAMIDAFGAVGPRHWKGRCARNRLERWIKEMIIDVRAGRRIAPKGTALHAISWHKDLNGKLLDPQIAAVELLNILRPITAIATYVTFGALALHTNPDCAIKIKSGDENYLHNFVEEIRRYYPFGPFLGARVRNDFVWYNHHFQKGTLVFLDIFGTNHDPRIWEEPYHFNPENFEDREKNPFDFIPQGGGDYEQGTRCPGEWLTVELLKVSMDFLVNRLQYYVPLQDLNFSLSRIPTLPKSKFFIRNIKRTNS
jgi:fatty-acid peroxygenase